MDSNILEPLIFDYIQERTLKANSHLLNGDKDLCMLLLSEVEDMCEYADDDKYRFFWVQTLRENT